MVDVSQLARVRWHGKWIWHPQRIALNRRLDLRSGHDSIVKESEKNTFMLFRHVFHVEPGLEHAKIYISADSRYKLFVNGQYVGRGINRCEAYYWYYDIHDITPLLREGKNVIAVHARFYGEDFAYYTSPGGRGTRYDKAGKGGLLFDIELRHAGGRVAWSGSGEGTRVLPETGHRSDMPLKNDALGYLEECDTRAIPATWNELDFDDSSWITSASLDYPIKTLLLDENQPLHEETVHPSAILATGECDDVNEDMDEEDRAEGLDFCIQHVLEGALDPVRSFTITNEQALLGKGGTCEIVPGAGARGRALAIVVRFPHEMVGHPRLVVEAPAGTIVDIIPTEKETGGMPRVGMETKRGSRVVLRGGKQFFEQWDWEGYLYMLLKIRNATGPVRIHAVATNRIHMRVSSEGSFTCDDEGLNALWKACALTVLCCATDGYLDCPSREQRAYLGDAYPEALIANACFGEPRLTRKLIYDTAFGQRQDGMTYSFHPGDAVPQTHVIPDYCLYWMQLARDYHLYHGDERVLDDMYPHFLLAIEWFWKYIDEGTGLLANLPYWTFIDWSFPHDKPGTWAILNAQFMDVLSFVGDLAERFHDARHATLFKAKAAALRETIDRQFWDEAEGCYRDYHHDGALHGLSYMTNAYLVLTGVTTDPARIDRIVSRIFEDPATSENVKAQIDGFYEKRMSHHAFGDALKERVIVAQPFFMHHVNKFLAMAGRYDLLLGYLRKWLPMLAIGKTGTIWETWSIDGSECHAWAATPAFDLSTWWLGVRPAAPGFERLDIAPTFHGVQHVEGTFPTCKGDIAVAWRKEGNAVNVSVTVPAAISHATFTVPPLDGRVASAVTLDGERVDGTTVTLRPGTAALSITYPAP